MKVLMISIDKGLLGKGQLGDVVQRHRAYASQVERLDIIVLNQGVAEAFVLSETCTAYPTNSEKATAYFKDAAQVAQKLVSTTQYDLIVCQDPFATGLVGVSLKKKTGIKLLVGFHGDFLDPYYWQSGLLKNLAMKYVLGKTLKHADHFRVVSEGIKQSLIEKKSITADRISVVPTPVDIAHFQRDEKKIQEIKTQFAGKKIILYVGRLVHVKNIPMLLAAYQQIEQQCSNTVLVILGDGELKGELEQQAKSISNNIYFVGQVDHETKLQYCYAADMLVLSSESESFGKVLVEANACGIPVVSTATTGAKSIVEDGVNGYLTPVGDQQQFAIKIVELLNDESLARKLGEQGQHLVAEKFGSNSEKIVPMWKEVVGK